MLNKDVIKKYFSIKAILIAIVLAIMAFCLPYYWRIPIPGIKLPFLNFTTYSSPPVKPGTLCALSVSSISIGFPLAIVHGGSTSSCSGSLYFNPLGLIINPLAFLVVVNLVLNMFNKFTIYKLILFISIIFSLGFIWWGKECIRIHIPYIILSCSFPF